MKMYILIKDTIPLAFAMAAAAHASLAMYLRFRDTPEISEWLSGAFRKVVCKVSKQDFDEAKQVEDNVVLTESGLDEQEVAIAFKPRNKWPEMFRSFKLYR